MKKLILLIMCTFLYADTLKSLLDYAQKNNNIIQSKTYIENSKQKDLESAQNAYYPTLKTYGQAGDVYSGYVSVGVSLYDGGRKDSMVNENKALLNSAKYNTSAYQKSLSLDIVQDFFNIQSVKDSLAALLDKKIQLKAQVARIKKFYEVGSATKDDVDRLKAAYSNNIYLIYKVKFQILSLKKLLALKIGKEVTSLDKANIQEPKEVKKNLSDSIKELELKAKSLSYVANKINSAYKPQVRFEDKFSLYGYGRSDTTHLKGQDYKNSLMISFNIRFFDNNVMSKQKESIMLQKMALQKQIHQLKRTQNINIELALSKIYTVKAQIKSAKSFLDSAKSAYETISQKFKAGIVDNIVFLDALSVKTDSKAVYEKAINDLQITYAQYYYYMNKDVKDFVSIY